MGIRLKKKRTLEQNEVFEIRSRRYIPLATTRRRQKQLIFFLALKTQTHVRPISFC